MAGQSGGQRGFREVEFSSFSSKATPGVYGDYRLGFALSRHSNQRISSFVCLPEGTRGWLGHRCSGSFRL